jgi:hypothetical protein
VSESKSGPTSILRPLANTIFKAQAGRLFPSWSLLANPTATNRLPAARLSPPQAFFVAILLVVGVVFLFLQTWRATIIPVVAIPVSLIGTFAILALLGISLNNLSLFGLVLAVGIVVDDAIVVVENVERNIRSGMSPQEAAHRTMDEAGGH